MVNTKEILLDNIKAIARVIAETYGRNCEVIVQDLKNLANSVVYVAGNVTGREQGAPATDLLTQILREEGRRARDVIGYKAITKDGRVLKSSTAFIRDEQGEIFASLSINYDVTDLLNSTASILEFANFNNKGEEKKDAMASSVQETIESLVNVAIQTLGKQPSTMMTEDKVRMVAILEERGAFLIKGAVDYVAVVLGVSRFTVYNYLNKVRSTSALNIM